MDVKIACLDDSVHLFVHRQSRVEDDAQQLDIVHDRHTRITDLQTCVGRTLHELLSCTKCDRLGLASIEQGTSESLPRRTWAASMCLLMTVPQCRAGYCRHTEDS